MMRVCKKCGEEKPIEEFAIGRDCKDGHRYTCKTCMNKSRLEPLNQKIIDRIDLFRRGLKICCICKETKPLYDFYPREITADGLETNCKKCSNAIGRKYKNNNKEKCKIKQKEWELKNIYRRVGYRKREYFKNFERWQLRGKKYRESHITEIKEYLHNYCQRKLRENDRIYIERNQASTRRFRANVGRSYAAQILKQSYNLPLETVYNYPELIELKQIQLKLKKLANEKRNRIA